MNRSLRYAAFLIGLAAVLAVGFGSIGSNPIALAVTVLIGAFYVMGALELHRFDQATETLSHAVAELSAPPSSLGSWLDGLAPSLRNAVRLRVEGERVGLPGPALTPYLTGLLVLLGMLGTFLGMVVTLKGTGSALESAADLSAIRASLAAPVKGLGLAFGTSLAGVATSAMLGLISALCRRDRLQAAQVLDTRIAGSLRVFSQAHQRDESFKLLQRQGEVLPALVDRLQTMMATMERQSEALNERLVTGQRNFYTHAEAAYGGLAASVGRSLNESLTESARAAGATLQPVVEAAMAGIARETAVLHQTIEQGVQRQLDGLSSRFEASTTTVADIWKHALGEAGQAHADLQTQLAARDEQRLAAWTQSLEAMAASLQKEWQQASANAAGQQQEICKTLADTAADISTQTEAHARNTIAEIARLVQTAAEAPRAAAEVIGELRQQLGGLSSRFEETTTSVADIWKGALAHHQGTSEALTTALRATLGQFADTFEQRSAALVDGVSSRLETAVGAVGNAHTTLQDELASRDEERLAAWNQSLVSMAASLQKEWQQAGAQAAAQQQEICKTLADTAVDISAKTEAHAKNTIGEIAQLMQTAAEAPRAAAEVIGELRQQLSASMARDNAVLEERSRIMQTLETLLNAVNHASTEQRAAIDALVSASADVLERVGSRFTDKVEAETGKLNDVAAHVTSSAVEVASMGEAFGFAVQQFSESNDKLGAQLERIEGALGKSLARSDEQLAYYVAQAREVIDLSILSQKQIVEDMQQIAASQRALAGSEA